MIEIDGPGIREARVLDPPCKRVEVYYPWKYVEGG
jgi:hypothetical protein